MVSQFDRLYYQDPYLSAFSATVTHCRPGKDGFLIELDRTAFYPEGGGQPADTGYLNDVRVLDVHEVDGAVVHTTDIALQVGSIVQGRIDWDRRFMLMQQHSGEHILSGMVNHLFGYQNVGFHIGSDGMTLDFSGELNDEQMAQAERLANAAVFENRPIEVCYPSPEERSQMDYRSKIELGDEVRLVRIPQADQCACCGLHVARTGEIGLIKIISAQKYKGGSRLWVVCGNRALMDYTRKNDQINTLSSMLSRKKDEVLAGVEQLQGALSDLKSENARLRSRLIDMKADAYTQALEGSEDLTPDESRICLFEEDFTPDDLRLLSALLTERTGRVVAVFTGTEGERYRYAVASKTEDMRIFGKNLNRALNGQGGGTPGLIQGSVQAGREDIRIWFSQSITA